MLQQSTKQERIHAVDALRGFALFGIILANIPFSGEHVVESPLNQTFDFFHNVFIAHKFIAMFSMLFGFGFYIQFQRFHSKGIRFTRYFLIRMALLFLIGCLHGYLLWTGDIIRAYAFGGIVLLLVRNWSVKSLLMLAVILNVLLTGIMYIVIEGFEWQTYEYSPELYEQHRLTTSYMDYLRINWRVDQWVNFLQDMPLTLFYTFGNMLIGFALAKLDFFRLPERLKRINRYMISLGLLLGLALNYVFYLMISGQIVLSISLIWLPFVLAAGMILLCLAYISIFLRLFKTKTFKKVLSIFNPIGRMALTNYIMQSVFYILVFYHCLNGLGFYGKLTHGESYLVAVLFFGLQVLFSMLWLKKFKQGPIEWIWKKAAYYFAR